MNYKKARLINMNREELIKKLVDEYEQFLNDSTDEQIQRINDSNDFVVR